MAAETAAVVESRDDSRAVPRPGTEGLKRGNTVGVGRKKGVPQPSGILSDFRYVYQKQESEDKTEGHRVLRTYLKEKPTEFVRQMIQMELQHAARKAKKQARMVEEVAPKVTVEEEDDGVERAKGMLDRALEEFDS